MNNYADSRLPIHHGAPNSDGNLKRNRTVRYYAHRVKESLTTRLSKIICTLFLSLLGIVGIILFILWLNLRPHRPRVFIEDFSVPGLAQENGFQDAKIIFNVTVRNSNQGVQFDYDGMRLTLVYQDQTIGGASLLLPLYQLPKNTTVLAGVLTGSSLMVTNQIWQQFLRDRQSRGLVRFQVQLTSVITFKVKTAWESKRHRMHANCPVEVGKDGMITSAYRGRRCAVYFS
ncbi:unnamed protein product [Cuscuta epithymum]|uniref:Late embryogenesis abundant protein LEA-2 subgroup domain-containing protein n=1 Tax=Cuscuta epithymum TaxID=186058 RepID=A0AAV0FDR5_9ASTE|nr:unnamed protein product [Cuscuta epithymum]